jgi:hypothetical protein
MIGRVEPREIQVIRELKDDAFALTQLVRMDGRHWLRKEFRFRVPMGRLLAPLARYWARHEMEVGRALAGIDGVPGAPVPVSETCFCRPWIEGRDLRAHLDAGGALRDDFFDRLLALVREIHRRGIAYADLQKKDNIIVGTDGRPSLIDFQISLRRYQGRSAVRRAISAWWVRHSQADDLRHVYKHKRRLRPDLLTPDEEARSLRRSPVSWLKRIFYAKTLRHVKRLVYPHGSNETFRFSREWRQRGRGREPATPPPTDPPPAPPAACRCDCSTRTPPAPSPGRSRRAAGRPARCRRGSAPGR